MANRFSYSAKMVLYVIAGLLPLLFLPQPLGTEYGREIVFGVLILIAAMLWLVSILTSGEISFARSPILYLAGAVLAVFGASTLFSDAPMISAVFADITGEKFIVLVSALTLMVTAGSILRSPGEAGALVFILIFSGAVSAGLNAFQLLVTGYQLPVIVNVVGTVNGLALFYAVLLMITAGLILSPAFSGWKRWVRLGLVAAAALFLFDLALINFRASWIALLGAAVFLFGLLLIERQVTGNSSRLPVTKFGWRHWAALALVGLAILMIAAQKYPVIPRMNLPLEVAPSFPATMRIAGSVFREGPLEVFFGSGPGTFGLDWLRYKDPAINQTVFWGVRFNQGQSWVATLLPTAGVLGFAAFLAFIGGALVIFLKPLLAEIKGSAGLPGSLAASVFSGFVAASISAFLYPANFTLIVSLFLGAGALLALLKIPTPDSPGAATSTEVLAPEGGETSTVAAGFWDIKEVILRLQAPWAVFISSLLIIFLLALGVMGIYRHSSGARSALARQEGIEALSQGRIDEALVRFERAAALEIGNPVNHQLLVQGYTERVRGIIQRAGRGENVSQEFQQAVSSAIQRSQQAVQIHPREPSFWRLQGSLYELAIPFVQGAERPAFAAYEKAVVRDPQNPAIYTEWGRAGLVFADRVAALAGQAQAKERGELEQARKAALEEVTGVFRKAIEVKSDFAPAHFLLAQTLIRLGDLDQAIRSVENARQAAPSDIGVAFQLGLLYYQKNDLARAEAEFSRAVLLNDNYSNARYFLGLIYDRRGESEKAIIEFERIAALNPGNPEIKRILENLRAGKAALAGIVPPAEAPEKRKDTPVKEQEGRK